MKFLALALFTAPAFAGQINFTGSTCFVGNVTAVTPAGVNWTATTTSSVPQVTCVTPPSGSCTTGTPSDVAGYTTQCTGPYTFHSGTGGDTVRGNATTPYTFKFVFGNMVNEWPGGPFGPTSIFKGMRDKVISIPFTPTPGHTITLNINGTYSPQGPVSESVSTSPALFNNGAKGNGVVCVQATRPPSLIISSNGNTANCVLEANKQYWFNVIPASWNGSNWVSGCTATLCNFGVTINKQN